METTLKFKSWINLHEGTGDGQAYGSAIVTKNIITTFELLGYLCPSVCQ